MIGGDRMIEKWVHLMIDRWTTLTVGILISLLWIFSSLFIVTCIPATIAATRAMRYINQGYWGTVTIFFQTFADRAISGLLIGIPYLLILSLSWINIQIMLHSSHLILAIIYIGVIIFINFLLQGIVIQSVSILSNDKRPIHDVLFTAWGALMMFPSKTILITFAILLVIVISVKIPIFILLADGAVIGWLILKLEEKMHFQ